MSNFSRIRAPGTWTPLSPLAGSEVELFDDHQSKTINAKDGSTHAPTSQIVIGGQGIKVTGNLVADVLIVNSGKTSTWNAGSFLSMLGTLSVGSGGVLDLLSGSLGKVENGAEIDVEAGGAIHVLGGSLTTNGASDVQFTGTTTIELQSSAVVVTDAGTWTHSGPHAWSSGSSIAMTAATLSTAGASTVTWGGTTAITFGSGTTKADASTTTRTGPTVHSGPNARRSNRTFDGTDANGAYVPGRWDMLFVPQLTGNRTYTFDAPDDPTTDLSVIVIWYPFGTNPGGGGTLLGPGAIPASSFDLTIISAAGGLAVSFAHHPGTINPDTSAQFYRIELQWRASKSDWFAVGNQTLASA